MMVKFLKRAVFALVLAMFIGGCSMSIDDTVVTKEVTDGVSAEDAIEAMLSKASEVNIKYVGNIPLYKELRARNVETGHLEIFQFCNPEDAKKMTDISVSFAAYLPCRIVLVEKDKKLYLTMLDLNPIIKAASLEGDLLEIAKKVNKQLNDIMVAGATGEF